MEIEVMKKESNGECVKCQLDEAQFIARARNFLVAEAKKTRVVNRLGGTFVDLGLHVAFNCRPRANPRRVVDIKLPLGDGASAASGGFLLFAFHESGLELTDGKANQHVADHGAGGVIGNEPAKFLWGLRLYARSRLGLGERAKECRHRMACLIRVN